MVFYLLSDLSLLHIFSDLCHFFSTVQEEEKVTVLICTAPLSSEMGSHIELWNISSWVRPIKVIILCVGVT